MEHTWLSTFPEGDGMRIPYRVNVPGAARWVPNVRTDVDKAQVVRIYLVTLV